MKRQAAPKAAAGIALFPFLAVLLCTMGGLIVLLVVIARHAKEQAAAESPTAASARNDLEIEREDLQWRSGHLRTARDKTAAQLADARSDISHLEDHIRRLRTQLAEVDRSMAEFDRLRETKVQDAAQARARIDDLRRQIRETEAEIENNRRGRPKSQSYAILPFDGPHQTHRRPIYIECQADAIILQPEGIELIDADFIGPPGPGNPLAAGLRAAREYLVKHAGSVAEEPYPLLLVRPDGIPAYYAARDAMRSWGADFGYEFIDQDWKLEFKPPEAGLAVALSSAIEDARRRQAALALAAPGMLTSRQRMAYRALLARSGGAAGGASLAGVSSAAGVAGQGSADASDGSPSSEPPQGEPPQSPAALALADSTSNPNGALGGQPDGPPLKGLETPGKPYAGPGGDSTSAGRDDGPAPPTAEEIRTPKRSLASARGKDWGLPGDHRAAVAVTRPIVLRCYGDHLVVMHEAGDRRASQLIPFGYRTQDSVDSLVTAVHERIDSWGMAGRGMYWRPTLVVEVAAGGKARSADLRELLTDSGLELREKDLAAAPGASPPNY